MFLPFGIRKRARQKGFDLLIVYQKLLFHTDIDDAKSSWYHRYLIRLDKICNGKRPFGKNHPL